MKSSAIIFLSFFLCLLTSCNFDYVPESKSEHDKRIEREKASERLLFHNEEDAQFPGGQNAMAKWLQMNIRYPEEELDRGIGGRVHLRFVVSINGDISNVTVSKGVSPGLDKEAVRAVKSMPRWKPAKRNGKPVNMWYNLPIKFNPE